MRWATGVEVFNRNTEFTTIRAHRPGRKKGEVTVDVSDDTITIQGERRRERDEEREGLLSHERSGGSYCRVIPLPEGAMSDQAKVALRDRVLEIRMPAPPASKGWRLQITEGAAT